jgi:hypothetical protein
MIEAALGFWSQHIILSNLSHAAGGFGLAVVLQRYLRGEPFLPVIVGWILLGFAIATHLYAFTR